MIGEKGEGCRKGGGEDENGGVEEGVRGEGQRKGSGKRRRESLLIISHILVLPT